MLLNFFENIARFQNSGTLYPEVLQQLIINFLLSIVALITAITVHEFSHALTADKLGDPTARLMKRVTLNPLSHLEPFGTLLLLLIGFGWGKPVQFDPYNLKYPKRDSALIALAGPFSNLLLAAVFALLMRLWSSPALVPFIFYNILLAVFNLIPIHPLDGGKILVGLLPKPQAHEVDLFMQRYGTFLLLLAIFPIFGGISLVNQFVSPVVSFLLKIYLPSSQFI